MVSIILHGCCGRMGRMIAQIAAEDADMKIVAGVDAFGDKYDEFPVYRSLQECPDADVLIDFSTASAMDGLFAYCTEHKLPAVICTTGLSDAQTEAMKKMSAQTAVLKSANMSLGINLLEAVLGEVAPKLAAAGFDIEVVEKHHNQKLDAPSGTAIALADAANEALGNTYEYVYDRSQVRQKRDKKELGISAVRGGTIPGTHEIIFAGPDEVIELRHVAYSRSIFGNGAISAAKYLAGREPGLYDMNDVIAAMQQ